MAIGIEFRLKAGRSGDSGEAKESKAYKQLKMDFAQLEKEHSGQVFYSYDQEAVTTAGQLLYRTYNQVEKGHKIN